MQNEMDYRKYLNLVSGHKRLFAVTALTIMTGAVMLCYILPKKFEARSVIFVQRNVLSDLLRGVAATPSVEDTMRGLNSTIKSRTLLAKVANDLDLNVEQNGSKAKVSLTDLQNRTTVQLNDREGLITISFTDKNPQMTRDYVNALVRRYIEENLSQKYGATTFLSEQTASLKEKLDKTEAEIARFRAEKGAALAVEAGSIQTEINTAQQRMDELILRRSQLEATRNQLRSNNPARTRLAALQRRLEELRVEYTDNYPEVVKVKADIETARSEIGRMSGGGTVADPQELARVEAELSAVRTSEANQRALLANSRGLLRANPAARTELEKLEQERNRYRTMYDQLMTRYGQAEASKQMEVEDRTTTFKVMEPATLPTSPVSPNRVRIILMGIAAGIACGFGLLLALDYFDNSVKMAGSLKALGLPLLAVIPLMRRDAEIQVEKKNDLRLYILSGSWFCVIVAVLIKEALRL